MNRIRKVDNKYQVLITPDIRISPDSALLIGNWEDESLRNYYILQFESLNDALCEAYNHPDLDWYRIVLNHEHIFKRLEMTIRSILNEHNLNVEFKGTLMDAETFKNTMFERVIKGGERFNLRYGMNDLISFTITNPWSNNLHNISKMLENYRAHLYRDDLRLRHKKIIDGKIICLYGYTEFGTIYEIRLVPTLIQQWAEWNTQNGTRNESAATKLYQDILKKQQAVDAGPIIR
ncbi:hypothetical protein QKU48_gp0807 [Fadolivirus algeromassiliense]|jgi:hypothetical protein|uniref:Uncharacterized protein n=1 Tax=Fadolivirus FV1/VV64 TaxID=3070911 RepID=A0A7D3QUM6_9VIRU|nr:hypothetical protein QKU48_gp0807 [Fadolivirus algeromassiliense]QKF94265.1 hypothetical protein Fadolivirus_1_807 [Fadolivirus FV1/VV64]